MFQAIAAHCRQSSCVCAVGLNYPGCTAAHMENRVWQSGLWILSGCGKIDVYKKYAGNFLAVLSDMKKAVTTGDSAGQNSVMKQSGPSGPGPCSNTGT